jgi:ATP-dependent protease Clp ATPase subunit
MPRQNSIKGVEMVMRNCLFCGRSRKQCAIIIEGPLRIHICDQCVDTCAEIIAEERLRIARSDGNQDAQEHAVTPSASAAQK